MGEYFDEHTTAGSKAWLRAMFTGPIEAVPQNLALGLIVGDSNGLGVKPATISDAYAANKTLGKTVD